ncbi:hypothetical protein ABMB44_13855 [Levilactobacillus brevis]
MSNIKADSDKQTKRIKFPTNWSGIREANPISNYLRPNGLKLCENS